MDPKEMVEIELETTAAGKANESQNQINNNSPLPPITTTTTTTTPPLPIEENGFILLPKFPNTAIGAVSATATATTPTPPTTPPPASSGTSLITINHKLPEPSHALVEVIEPETPTPIPTPIPTPTPNANQPSTSREFFHEAAILHGGNDTNNFLQAELGSIAANQIVTPRVRTASSTLDASVSRYPSTSGKHEKKIGHRRVDEGGEVTYKRIQSKQIMGSIQLGIQHTIGSLASKPKRDLLMNDFWEMETISFPAEGSSITPAHHYNDFRFKVYAPIAFRYFRDLFGIAPDDFLMSMCAAPLVQLSNPGASGSIFYLTDDDEFIIKTVQKKEGEFLQKLLPGYYMNLSQNPRTLLPKFFGLYCFHYNAKNVRLVAMNNLLPSEIKMHAKYDLKGSTFRRKASKAERQKASPTYKDLDFMDHHPNGLFLETDKYNALIKTIQRDCMVLESFQIMDYSLLVGIHNLDIAQKEKREERIRNARAKLQRTGDEHRDSMAGDPEAADTDQAPISAYYPGTSHAIAPKLSTASTISGAIGLNRTRSMNRPRLVAHSTAIESITADMDMPIEEDEDVPAGGIPARSENDERLILYIGIIDILQSYRLEKKLEHTFKSIIYNGDTVSVCRPSFYAQRFQNFMGKTVFKKTPTFPLKHSPSKRKTSNAMLRTPLRNAMQSQSSPSSAIMPSHLRTNITGSSTPPPAFDDISEEDITATSSTTGYGMSGISGGSGGGGGGSGSGSTNYNRISGNARHWQPQRSVISSTRSVVSSSNITDEYGDTTDDDLYSGGSSRALSPVQNHNTRSPRLSKTNVQLTTIGDSDDESVKPNNRIVVAVKSAADADTNDGNANVTVLDEIHKNPNRNGNGNGKGKENATGNGSESANKYGNGNGNGNGEHSKVIATTKTTIIKAVQSQIYTSTLVLNDVSR